MILLINPRVTRPEHRRFPLSVLSLAAALPEGKPWELLDGNRPGFDVAAEAAARVEARRGTPDDVSLLAFTVMPGPQLPEAVRLTRLLKERFPEVPTVWGGYFPSLYPEPVLAAPYVDFLVRGQGETTFLELLDVLALRREAGGVLGLGYRERGSMRLNPERLWVGPDAFPPIPYARIDVDEYLHPTFLGRRTGAYQASIGCPYTCKFCGVISVYGSREKVEEPSRTEASLRHLVERHAMDGLHFYDNNFFLGEERAREMAGRLARLNLSWWCEARIDAMLRFGNETWKALRQSGLKMVFFGAESGSDAALLAMSKGITTAQTLELARLSREHGIVPEFSFVLGDPEEPEREIDTTLAFVRKLKEANSACELILYFYTPTPQRRATYGNVDARAGTPETLEEWCEPEWMGWMTHESPRVPWMTDRLRAKVDGFRLVLEARFPSLHDVRTRDWGKALAQRLSRRRWDEADFESPRLLAKLRRLGRAGRGERSGESQLYGHLRPASPGTAP